MPKRKRYDWEAIEKEYRLGQKTLRMLSKEFGPAFGTIGIRARKEGWVQDKSLEVRQKTKAALLKHTKKHTRKAHTPSESDVDAAVQVRVEVIRGHRTRIAGALKMVETLTEQLNEAADGRDDLKEEIEKETEGADGKINWKRRNALMKAVSLPSHAGVLKNLSTALKSLVPLEREAFNLDEDTFDRAIKELINNLSPAAKEMIAKNLAGGK